MKTGWQTERLGDITALVKGKKPKLFNKDGVRPYLTAKVIRGTEVPKMVDSKCPVSVWAKPEDIVIIMDGSNSGEMFTGLDGALASTMGIIKFNEKVLTPRYLLSFLITHRDNFTKSRTGAAIPHLNKEEFENLEIPVPSISEQKRIVKILDEAFEKIDKAKENAEINIQNSKDIFEGYLQKTFTQHGRGWAECRLGDIFNIGSSKRIYATDWTPSGVPFYGGKEIVKLAKTGSAVSNAYISEDKYQDYAKKYDMPQKGDVLMTARGTIGVCYIVKEGDRFYYKDGNIISFREKIPTNPLFLVYAFKSKAITAQIESLVGATVKHLPIEKAKEIVLMMPDFDSQNTTVKKIQKIETETLHLEKLYKQKIADLDELKKSVLSKAFAGEL